MPIFDRHEKKRILMTKPKLAYTFESPNSTASEFYESVENLFIGISFFMGLVNLR